MEQAKRQPSLIHNPGFQVFATWLWIVLFPLLAIGVVVGILKLDLATVRQWWGEHQYYQGYFEATVAGLLPALFVWVNRERLSRYGIQRAGFAVSLLFSLLVVIAVYAKSFLTTGEWISHSSFGARLDFPQAVWLVSLGIFANGPLEVFFFVWLVTKTDQILGGEGVVLSKGFLLTVALFSLLHIISTQSVVNALHVLVIFFFLGLIYKHTRNSIGPMIGWTLINGMVWAFVELLCV